MKFIIGNWKMSLSYAQAKELAKNVAEVVKPKADTAVIVCPSTVSLSAVAEEIKTSDILLGAQDCFWEEKGAYTGMNSPQVLAEIGCKYVIIGHSERRQHLGETDDMVNKKIIQARQIGLIPIVCVGETFEQRRNGVKDAVISQQTIKALAGVSPFVKLPIIIAYEPVWVIGSGQAVEPQEASHACNIIRQAVREVLPDDFFKDNIYTIYGGSVTADNAANIFSQPGIDGVLVGGASLDAGHFNSLIKLL